jgi:hypothetical protein
MRIVPKECSFALHADAPAAVRMIHENQFAAIGMCLFQGREFSRNRAERFDSWLLVLRAWFFFGGNCMNEARTSKH